MKAIGELYYIPEKDSTARPFPIHLSLSLAGARTGDYCPAHYAEVKAPANETKLITKWGVFMRVKVENRPPGYKQEPEIIEAWLRV